MGYIFGFDLGTSACKAILFDEELNPICSAKEEYPTISKEKDWAEQPAEQWWAAFCRTTSEIIEKSGINPSEIEAVGVDTMGSVLLPMDKNGNPLRPALLWMDRRSNTQCTDIDQALKDRLFEITGNRNDPSNIAPKLLWLKQNEPDNYHNAWKFLHANGYLVYKLTNVMTMDVSECCLTTLCDMKKGEWSPEIFRALDLDIDKLPDIYECSEVVGKVTKEAAQVCGLCEGTPVIAGLMDVISSAVGTSSLNEGDVYIAGGTVTAVGIIHNTPRAHMALHLHNHGVPGKYISVSAVDFGGGGLRWFRNIMEYSNYDELNKMAAQAPPGNDGLIFLPYMVGQRTPLYNGNTQGVMFGLTPEHEKRHLARMFMEGTSYAIRNILEFFMLTGIKPTRARITGGISNSDTWVRIMTDITGLTIDLCASVDVAATGAAATAGVGIGMFKNHAEALSKQKTIRSYKCNPENTEIYDKSFSLFKNLYNNMLSSYDFAAEILR